MLTTSSSGYEERTGLSSALKSESVGLLIRVSGSVQCVLGVRPNQHEGGSLKVDWNRQT